MANGFHHLTRDERCQIYALRKRGVRAGFLVAGQVLTPG